jgi:hypothetical protein
VATIEKMINELTSTEVVDAINITIWSWATADGEVEAEADAPAKLHMKIDPNHYKMLQNASKCFKSIRLLYNLPQIGSNHYKSIRTNR